jgi:pilus assembly protein CpaE
MSLLESLGLRGESTQVQNAEFVAFINDEANTETMRRYVTQRMLPHAVVICGQIQQAITYLQKMDRPPLQLVIDVSNSDTPLSDLSSLAEECDPSVDVYVLGAQNDVGLYRSLLQLGIRDYLVKPLTVDLLTRTLGTAQPGHAEQIQRTRTGKVITVLGTRGGAGVSTVATHLALHLAEDRQRRVALVDLDISGGLVSVLLGMPTNQGLIDVLQNVQRLDPQYMDRTLLKFSNRLFVLSGEQDYNDFFEPADGALGQLIDVLKHYYHYVIIDSPRLGSGISKLTEEALSHSKLVYLLADRTVHSARNVMRLTRHISARANEPTVSVLMNHTAPVTSAHISKEDFASATQRPILLELPYDIAAITLAQNLGERLNQKSSFAKAIMQLANDLSGVEQAKEKSKSLWSAATRSS